MSEWASVTSGTPATLAPGVAILFASFSQASLGFLVPATLIRVRGMLYWDTNGSAHGRSFGAVGIAVVKETARVAGIASLPSPITEASDDIWLFHHFLQCSRALSTANGFRGDFVHSFEMDAKAMRKLEDGDAVVIVVENNVAVGSDASFNMNARFLFLNH